MAKYNINLYQYNNYSDKTLKYESSLYDYPEPVAITEAANFNFADGVNTTHVINGIVNIPPCNYAIVYEGPDIILSRWFVIESKFISNFKFEVTLLRDVLADYWTDLRSLPMYINKATVSDDNPLIYQKENVVLNQIKQGPDYLIKDETQCPWIVMYYKDIPSDTRASVGTIQPDVTVNGIANYQYYRYSQLAGTNREKYIVDPKNYRYYLHGRKGVINQTHKVAMITNKYGQWLNDERAKKTPFYYGSGWYSTDVLLTLDANNNPIADAEDIRTAISDQFDNMETQTRTLLNVHTSSEIQNLIAAQSDIIYDSSVGKYYRMTVSLNEYNFYNTMVSSGTIHDVFNNYVVGEILGIGGVLNADYDLMTEISGSDYEITITEIGGSSSNIILDSTANIMYDAPYGAIAFPYGNIDIYNTEGETEQKKFTNNADIAMRITGELMRLYGGDTSPVFFSYQIFPYCPVRTAIQDNNHVNIKDEKVYYVTDNNNNMLSVGICCKYQTAHFQIPYTVNLTNKKIQNQTDLYRIVSPGFKSQFDFNISMNNGLTGFDVVFSIRPYSPLCQVSPIFSNMYGANWSDGRGMICSENFELPVLTNSWSTYERNNSNYQNIFDRQTTSLEISNKWNITESIFNSILGSAGTGLTTGMLTENVGLGIGAGALSGVGGLLDSIKNIQLQQEQMSARQDIFNYQLGNIKALPDTLTKVGCLAGNYKIFPFLEYYTCTDEEKEIFANKIKYEGMTVGAIGTINDYINNNWSYNGINDKGFIQGQFLQINTINEDSHLLQIINQEMARGRYTK